MICRNALANRLRVCARAFFTVLLLPILSVVWMIGWSMNHYGSNQTTPRLPTRELHAAPEVGTLWPLKLIVDACPFYPYAACRIAR
ncbi:MAG: hypothetical protein ABR962_06645 [Candidatus Bathyarchaeia archaeon]